jgi:hypothetical protein
MMWFKVLRYDSFGLTVVEGPLMSGRLGDNTKAVETSRTLAPPNIRALEMFLGNASPCLMDQFTPKT